MAARIARGEVRLYQFAAPDKKRPALVLTRNSAIAYLSTVTVAPVTSTIRGVPSEVFLNEEDGMKFPCVVNLHNAVTVSQSAWGNVREELELALECYGHRPLLHDLPGSGVAAQRQATGWNPTFRGSERFVDMASPLRTGHARGGRTEKRQRGM